MRALPLPAIATPQWRVEGVRERAVASQLALWLGGITLAGLALRLFWVFYTDTIPLGGDPHWYYVVGINIAKGFGFVASRNELWEIPGPGEPTAFWPPGYPFALGALFKLSGVSITSAQVLNAVLGALTIPLVYGLGKELFTRNVGLAAAALFAIFPNVIFGVPLLFPEPLFTLIFIGALWLLLARLDRPGDARWAVAGFGLLVGLAMLTRGQGAVLLPVAALFWLARSGWRQAFAGTAIATLAAVAIIAPWTARNFVEMNAFVPISTNSGAALRVGHNEDSIGTTKWTREEIDGFRMWESPYRPDWEVTGYREYTDRAIGYALTHPVREVELAGLKVYHLYRSDSTQIPFLTTLGATPLRPDGLEDAVRLLLDYAWYALAFAAVLLLPFWLRRDARRLLLVNVVVIWTLFHVAFLGEPRYHIPLYPLFIIAAAGGVAGAMARAQSVWARRAP